MILKFNEYKLSIPLFIDDEEKIYEFEINNIKYVVGFYN